jgi:acetyltransferase
MSTYRLDRLIVPHSLAVVGASPREASVGRHVVANLIAAGFAGPVHVVNPNYGDIEGISTVKSIDAIAGTPDVVVIAVPPAAVPETVAAAGAKGAAAAIIITAGLGHGPGSLAEAADRAARATGLRLVGPNSLGVLVPPSHFNASFAPRMPGKGDLAVISQSGAIVAGMQFAGAAVAAPAASPIANAQTYPSRPITIMARTVTTCRFSNGTTCSRRSIPRGRRTRISPASPVVV